MINFVDNFVLESFISQIEEVLNKDHLRWGLYESSSSDAPDSQCNYFYLKIVEDGHDVDHDLSFFFKNVFSRMILAIGSEPVEMSVFKIKLDSNRPYFKPDLSKFRGRQHTVAIYFPTEKNNLTLVENSNMTVEVATQKASTLIFDGERDHVNQIIEDGQLFVYVVFDGPYPRRFL